MNSYTIYHSITIRICKTVQKASPNRTLCMQNRGNLPGPGHEREPGTGPSPPERSGASTVVTVLAKNEEVYSIHSQ